MNATRLDDLCTGHDACNPVALIEASKNVMINGRGAGRVGDSYLSHSCPEHPPHTPHIANGSATVFVNGKSLARIGDAVDCGGSVMEGSENVFAGD